MTPTQSFKNGMWIHSPAVLGIPPDVCFYRTAPGRYAFGDNTSPSTYVAANRGLEIAVGVALPDFTAVAAGLTVNMRTQSAGGVGPSNGGDLIILTGNPTGAGRRGYVNITGAGAGAQTTMIGATAGGFSTGADCTFLGFAAGRDMVAAINGTFIGSQAGLTATGANNTAIGAAAGIEVARANNVVIGSNASAAAGDGNVVLGGFADLDAAAGVLIGATGILSANQSVAIGSNINVTSAFSVTLGDAAVNPMASSIVMGHAATTSTANTMVCGSPTDPINILYGGKGEKSAAPTAWMVSGTAPRDGTDVDTDGAALQLAGGHGTGNGLRGNVEMSFSRIVGAGSGAQRNEVCLAFRGLTVPASFTPYLPGDSGATMYTRTQTGGGVGNTTGGNWIVQLGAAGAAAAAGTAGGYFNVTGVSAGVQTTFIGQGAGSVCTGANNVFYGYHAGRVVSSGTDNTMLGNDAGDGVTTGNNNTIVGSQAGNAATAVGMSNTTAIGYRAGNVVTGADNTLVGSQAGLILSSGAENTLIGKFAGYSLTTENDNVLIGYYAGLYQTASLCIAIGYNANRGDGGKEHTGQNNVAIGNYAAERSTTAGAHSFNDCIAIGASAGRTLRTGVSNVFVGGSAGYGAATGITGNYNVGVGPLALFALSSGADNCALGYNTGVATTTGARNVFIGTSAGTANLTGNDMVCVGKDAGANLLTSYGVAIGAQAQVGATDGGGVAVGYAAGQYRTLSVNTVAIGLYADSGSGAKPHTGVDNTMVGAYAAQGQGASAGNRTFASSVFLGYQAGFQILTGNNNVFIGYNCAYNAEVTGSGNTCVGHVAVPVLDSGADNVVVGRAAGTALTSGAYNTLLGTSTATAAANGDYAIAVGQAATAHASSIVLGCQDATSTASNQFVAGSSSHPMTDVYFGKGVENAVPSDYTIHGTNGVGNDIGAGNLFLAGGRSTGNSTPGVVFIQTCISQASGVGLNALRDRLCISSVNNANYHSDVYMSLRTGEAAACTLNSITEEVTLTGAVTDSGVNLLPANSFIVGVMTYVTTTLPNARTWKAGTDVTDDLFMAAATDGTAGQQNTSFAHVTASLAPFINQTAAPVRITASNADAANGKIRVTVFYYTLTAPGS